MAVPHFQHLYGFYYKSKFNASKIKNLCPGGRENKQRQESNFRPVFYKRADMKNYPIRIPIHPLR